MSKTSAGTPSTRQMATRCNSPPDNLVVSSMGVRERGSLRLDILVDDWFDLHWLYDVGVELRVCMSASLSNP